jgi:hypothetical protein
VKEGNTADLLICRLIKRTFNIEKEYIMSDYNTDDLMYEVREVQSQNREMEQRIEFLTELVEKLLLTRSSYELRNPKQEAK